MRGEFSSGLANERSFSNGPGRAGKRQMSFPIAGLVYKKRKTINIARQSRPTKGRLSFQTGRVGSANER